MKQAKWKLYDITADKYYFGSGEQVGTVAAELLKQNHLIRLERSKAYAD